MVRRTYGSLYDEGRPGVQGDVEPNLRVSRMLVLFVCDESKRLATVYVAGRGAMVSWQPGYGIAMEVKWYNYVDKMA